jgi:3-deoxy-D-manno-octulosonic-acid transferase
MGNEVNCNLRLNNSFKIFTDLQSCCHFTNLQKMLMQQEEDSSRYVMLNSPEIHIQTDLQASVRTYHSSSVSEEHFMGSPMSVCPYL